MLKQIASKHLEDPAFGLHYPKYDLCVAFLFAVPICDNIRNWSLRPWVFFIQGLENFICTLRKPPKRRIIPSFHKLSFLYDEVSAISRNPRLKANIFKTLTVSISLNYNSLQFNDSSAFPAQNIVLYYSKKTRKLCIHPKQFFNVRSSFLATHEVCSSS